MKHEYYDICITGSQFEDGWREPLVNVSIDPTKNDNATTISDIWLTKEDIAALASHLGLVVYRKSSAL